MKTFPHLKPDCRVCSACRKKASAFNEAGNNLTTNERNFDGLTNEDTGIDDDEAIDNFDFSASSEIKDRSQREIDLEEMFDGLKSTFSSLKNNDPLKLKILTVAPSSWSARKIAREFKTTRYLAQKSKELKSVNGVLGETTAKIGNKLPQETVCKVEEFYNSDMNSRLMPSMKDVVYVKNEDGKREEKRKRLLLLSLKELYVSFKEKDPSKSQHFFQ